MTRLEVFENLSGHPWLGKVYKKLALKDCTLCIAFIKDNDGLDKGSFELAVNRMFLDKERPKRWKEICELLSCINSSIY